MSRLSIILDKIQEASKLSSGDISGIEPMLQGKGAGKTKMRYNKATKEISISDDFDNLIINLKTGEFTSAISGLPKSKRL